MTKPLFSLQALHRPLIGVVADSGQIARLAVRAEVDFLLALGAGVFRTRGVNALAANMPFANVNDLTDELVDRELLPRACSTPIIAGLLVGDPTTPLADRLNRFVLRGVFGIANYPSATLLNGNLKQIAEVEGWTFAAELDMLHEAKQRGLATVGFVCADPDIAAAAASSRVDALILSLGLTRVLDDIHERRDQLQHAIRQLNAAMLAAKQVNPALPCLAFGGPITMPEDLEQLYRQSSFDGFVGGSVFARLPVETGVTATIRRFQAIATPRGATSQSALGSMLGATPVMQRLFRLVQRAADCDLNVCIEGESGVGKELVATQIHRLSCRAHGPLVTLNCGAIPDTLLEAELFGHERGAFTGADRRRLGKFELAHQGTLFLDEVADLSQRGQVALLRAIQQREITRIGGDRSIQVDNRILAATNQPLEKLVKLGKFRADLFYRLNQVTLVVPPLRDRLDDLPLLVAPILAGLRTQMKLGNLELSPEFQTKLRQHAWPGNLRELQHVLYQAALHEEGPQLRGDQFTPCPHDTGVFAQVHREVQSERATTVREVLRAAKGNKSKAADMLGVSRKTLYAWLRELE